MARRREDFVFRIQEQVADRDGETMHAQTQREWSKKMKGMLKLWQEDVWILNTGSKKMKGMLKLWQHDVWILIQGARK
jgi:hypothetical protein